MDCAAALSAVEAGTPAALLALAVASPTIAQLVARRAPWALLAISFRPDVVKLDRVHP